MPDPQPSHYQRLGVTAAASTEEIRTAYRALAGRLHPDRLRDASTADRAFAERRMREINESWRVLRDPVSRRAYDDERAGARAAHRRPTATPAVARRHEVDHDDDLVDVLPPMTAVQAGVFRHLPWVMVLIVLAGIFLVTAYADHGDETPAKPSPAVTGECIDIASATATTIVSCAAPHDYRIVTRVVDPSTCPAGTEGRRLGTDGRFDCLATT